MRAQGKCSEWSSGTSIWPPYPASLDSIEKPRSTIQSPTTTGGHATSKTRHTGEMEDDMWSFFPPHRRGSQTEQEDQESRTSDYVLVDHDTQSMTLDTEYINDFGRLDCSDDKQRAAGFEHSTFGGHAHFGSGHEDIESNFASDFFRKSSPFAQKSLDEKHLRCWVDQDQLRCCSLETSWTGQNIVQQLSHANWSSNHNMACRRRLQSTCSWIFSTPQYIDWQYTPNSTLWVHGIGRPLIRPTCSLPNSNLLSTPIAD